MRTLGTTISILSLAIALALPGAACGDDGASYCDDDGQCEPIDGENTATCPGDCPANVCNDDGTCDTSYGETLESCPADCGTCNNDGTCSAAIGETLESCPADCGPCNHDGTCDTSFGETEVTCPDDCAVVCGDGTCDEAGGEDAYNCPADCPLSTCDNDGVCDGGETVESCPNDCVFVCELNQLTGSTRDFIVDSLFLPNTSASAHENGVDLDGDGDIDNKLGQIVQLMASNGVDDINVAVTAAIASGELIMLGRLIESGNSDGVVAVQTFEGAIYQSIPSFDGNDLVRIAPAAPTDLYLCGDWTSPDLETTPAPLSLPFPMIFSTGLVWMEMTDVQVRTVDNPSSAYYGSSSVATSGWTDVMVGGGLTQSQIWSQLIPGMAADINVAISQGGSTADTLADLFDGNCVVMSDVPGCETVVAGVGECDDSADPPVITVTEVLCNALMNSALSPDVDSDGDGYDDLLSAGFRIVSAVPVYVVP